MRGLGDILRCRRIAPKETVITPKMADAGWQAYQKFVAGKGSIAGIYHAMKEAE
jgi:hypothetical protein